MSTNLEHLCKLDINSQAPYVRLTGIICTIGSSCQSPEKLEKLIHGGMNIACLNFSHGTHEYHAETIKNMRLAVDSYSKKIGMYFPLAIALDTKGPEIRTGKFDKIAEINYNKGDKVILTTNKNFMEKGRKDIFYIDYTNIVLVVKVGSFIYIDDGLLSLLVDKIASDTLSCTIQNGGTLGPQKRVNLPGNIL